MKSIFRQIIGLFITLPLLGLTNCDNLFKTEYIIIIGSTVCSFSGTYRLDADKDKTFSGDHISGSKFQERVALTGDDETDFQKIVIQATRDYGQSDLSIELWRKTEVLEENTEEIQKVTLARSSSTTDTLELEWNIND